VKDFSASYLCKFGLKCKKWVEDKIERDWGGGDFNTASLGLDEYKINKNM